MKRTKLDRALEMVSLCAIAGCTIKEANTVLGQYATYPWNKLQDDHFDKFMDRIERGVANVMLPGKFRGRKEGPLQIKRHQFPTLD